MTAFPPLRRDGFNFEGLLEHIRSAHSSARAVAGSWCSTPRPCLAAPFQILKVAEAHTHGSLFTLFGAVPILEMLQVPPRSAGSALPGSLVLPFL